MKQPLLVIFIGVPGSGKTYFATKLAETLPATRLNSDGMRLSIFGSKEQIEKLYHSPQRRVLNSYTFGAMNYVTKTLLKQGTSVVYEAIQRTRADRRAMEKLAAECGARLVLVSMTIDLDVAIERVQARQEADDVRQFSEEKAREVVAHFSDNLEPLERTDYVVEIDGATPFEKQYATFTDFIS